MSDPNSSARPGDAQPPHSETGDQENRNIALRPATRPIEHPSDRRVFTPPIDIYEDEEGLVLHADLPGVRIDTLELQVQDNRLTLFGRVTPAVPPDARLIYQEYEVGDFLRSFILSDDVDHERITASLNNGVLKVVLPRAQRPEARRIPITSE